MINKFKYQLILIVSLITGALFIQSLINSQTASIQKERADKLIKINSEAVVKARAGIEVYATLVASLRSYVKNTEEFPTELRFHSYLKDLIKELHFNDSIVVSYIDTNHEFKYVFTPQKIDPFGLKGLNAKDLRPKTEIELLNNLMYSDSITLFKPINLREGWAGLPFNFSAKDSKNETLGYIAPILNVKYLLNYFYTDEESNDFVHRFLVNDTIDITREAVYDGTKIYNTKKDKGYYKNFAVNESNFIYTNINLYGLNLKLGSAYAKEENAFNILSTLTYLWYCILSVLSFIALFQFLKNSKLTDKLQVVNKEVELKNEKLETSLFKIQTLIKEIHHRVKNNMQMIGNLLDLQEEEYEHPQVKLALKETKNRIHSMSLIHEKLYGSSNLQDVNPKDYIEQLIAFVEETISNESLIPTKQINIKNNLIFDGETMNSLGLIINELITNSYKYAFRPNKKNSLDISLTINEDQFALIYSDSGPGLPENFDMATSDSLGMQLIYIFTEQLNGTVRYSNDNKSTFTIYFKKAEPLT